MGLKIGLYSISQNPKYSTVLRFRIRLLITAAEWGVKNVESLSGKLRSGSVVYVLILARWHDLHINRIRIVPYVLSVVDSHWLFNYSDLIAFTGFAIAALIASTLTVSSVNATVINAAVANIHHESEMR